MCDACCIFTSCSGLQRCNVDCITLSHQALGLFNGGVTASPHDAHGLVIELHRLNFSQHHHGAVCQGQCDM